MIQTLNLNSDKVMGWRMEGKINQEDYIPVIESMENKLNTTDHLNIYMEVPEMSGITPQAALEGIKAGFSKLKEYNEKLDRVAVVTDKRWIQTLANIENRLFPGVEEKAFSFEEAEKARDWIIGTK